MIARPRPRSTWLPVPRPLHFAEGPFFVLDPPALGAPRAMATTVDAEIWKHNISDGCHLQNDTVWFATVFHKCSYKHRILCSGCIYCAVWIMWLSSSDSKKMEPWLASKVLHDRLFWGRNWSFGGTFPGTTVYLCDFRREQAWERWVCDNTAWVVKMLNGFLISSVPVHGRLHLIPARRNHKTTTSNKPRMPSKAETCGRWMNMCIHGLAIPG